jgi:glycosyltransferase involved in cell wall biosynthesis
MLKSSEDGIFGNDLPPWRNGHACQGSDDRSDWTPIGATRVYPTQAIKASLDSAPDGTFLPVCVVGIAVPAFNADATLRETLESLRDACRNPKIEVVISDNHSTDGSAALINKFIVSLGGGAAQRVRVVRPPQHLSKRGSHWKFAVDELTSPWVMMLHADDVLLAGAADTLARAAQSATSDVALISGRAHLFSATQGLHRSPVRPAWQPRAQVPGIAYKNVLRWNCSMFPFTVIRREVWEDMAGFTAEYELLQDWDLWLRACDRGDVLLLPDVIAGWRQHTTTANYSRVYQAEHNKMAEAEFRDTKLSVIFAVARYFQRNRMNRPRQPVVLAIRIAISLRLYGLRLRYRTRTTTFS